MMFFRSKKVGKFQKIWTLFAWIVSIAISLFFIMLDLSLALFALWVEALSNILP